MNNQNKSRFEAVIDEATVNGDDVGLNINQDTTYEVLDATLKYFSWEESKLERRKTFLLKWLVEETAFLSSIKFRLETNVGDQEVIVEFSEELNDYDIFVLVVENKTNRSINGYLDYFLNSAVQQGLLAGKVIKINNDNEFSATSDESIAREMAELSLKFPPE